MFLRKTEPVCTADKFKRDNVDVLGPSWAKGYYHLQDKKRNNLHTWVSREYSISASVTVDVTS